MSQSLDGGPSDDGLLQRFQLATWPDPPRDWKLIDRTPNNTALATAEKVFTLLANLSADSPIRLHFDPEAQQLFFVWLAELERKIRTEAGLHPALIAHLAKCRSLLPTLAGLFELADATAQSLDAVSISLTHAQQAAAWCEYLESHAKRIYSCVNSPEAHARAIFLGHSSVRITEKHYNPWNKARQDQAEADITRSWAADPLVLLLDAKGTPEVHQNQEVVN